MTSDCYFYGSGGSVCVCAFSFTGVELLSSCVSLGIVKLFGLEFSF